MELDRFQELVLNFEKNIIVEGIKRKRFSRKKKIPTKNCKLSNRDFGKQVGHTIDTDIVLVIDYYGYLKRSRGFFQRVKKDPSLKEVRSYIIYFASIKMEDVSAMTSSVAVMLDFPRLKNEILILRGFRKNI